MLEVKNLNFNYPNKEKSLKDISFRVRQGEFVVICGFSGSGKTTLLRQLKPCIAPFGDLSGGIFLDTLNIKDLSIKEQAEKIGFVSQNADNQIVTDKVWHELAFGLESLSYTQSEIRTRVAEMATFFGINEWFYKNVTELSGGQRQILCLASILVMRPQIIILDEPTSQLDPIATLDFIQLLKRVNEELGITIIMSEHNLSDVYSICDQIIYMEEGKVKEQGKPTDMLLQLKNHKIFDALPSYLRVQVNCNLSFNNLNISIFKENFKKNFLEIKNSKTSNKNQSDKIISLKNVYFSYEKKGKEVLKDVSIDIYKGEIVSIIGANGSGKSTLLSVFSDVKRPYSGKRKCNATVVLLPQDPQTLFVKKTVEEDLAMMNSNLFDKVVTLLHVDRYFKSHPFDLSGGEQQLVAFAKILLCDADIILLDEPTKGFDCEFKKLLASTIKTLSKEGKTFIIVSHDVEFCAEYTETTIMMFNGEIISKGKTRDILLANSFYTSSLNRILCSDYKNLLLEKDVNQYCVRNYHS